MSMENAKILITDDSILARKQLKDIISTLGSPVFIEAVDGQDAINKYKDYKGEEWVWVKEPKRNVKMHFVNKAGEDIYAILENCKIMDIVDDNSMIVFIEKLRLTDNI